MKTLRQIIELSETSTVRPQPSEPVHIDISNLESVNEDYLAQRRERIEQVKTQG